jgi:hypothetical protein
MAIAFEIPIPGEEGVDASIGLDWELFSENVRWEVMDKLRSAVVNGFHIGFGFAELPHPAGGIEIVVTALEIEPALDQLNDADLERLATVLYWAAASLATSSWRGLHALTSK